jgi:rubrerythrin
MLADAGFSHVTNMQGGIKAWEGLVAEGPPEAGMAWFGDAVQPEKLTLLAWLLEEGSREFYARLDEFIRDGDAKKLFQDLAQAEESHKRTLGELHKTFSGGRALEESLPEEKDEFMEGGVRVDEALLWARERDVAAILEFAISLETNAYDLYLKMQRKLEGDGRKVFELLAGEEKKHLERLAALLEKKI